MDFVAGELHGERRLPEFGRVRRSGTRQKQNIVPEF
jgi:hypothetical protein